MSLQEEPLLEIDDIQGHILVGFRGPFQEIIGLKLNPRELGLARAALLPWVDQITSTRHALLRRNEAKAAEAAGAPKVASDEVLIAMALTSEGLHRLEVPDRPEDPDFLAGAARSAATVSDPVDTANGRPLGWKYGDTPEHTPDIVVILGGGSEIQVHEMAEAIIADLDGLATVLMREQGARLAKDKEHFGFVDGISQPAPRGRIAEDKSLVHRAISPDDPVGARFARPGRPLVWPGQYLFGERMQLTDSFEPGPVAGGAGTPLKNGSLLVLRRLRQDVAAFQSGMKELAANFAAQGLNASAATLAAWCIGRWPDGTPLVLSPETADPQIGENEYRRNGFLFSQALNSGVMHLPDGSEIDFPGAPADILGQSCPYFAHIRQVNPRDDPVDFGASGITVQAQMLRRGIPYGPPWSGVEDGNDRGLIFMSYQTSIANQFHRLMKRWVNDNNAPLSRSGIDPLIGADKPPGRYLERRRQDGIFVQSLLDGSWVTATGAVYAFTPGISAIRRMIAGPVS